ncbi:MAG: alpha-glucan family phosphorylase [Phycisphaerae bacterium]|nr:alpha-glucan family phosphorylase [Phycisphaerae bacterium]
MASKNIRPPRGSQLRKDETSLHAATDIYRLRTYTVVPALPEPLARLHELAYNLWWSWHGDAMDLFCRLDPDLWDDVAQNPVRFLAHVAQKRLDQAAADKAYLSHMERVLGALDNYMTCETWFSRKHPEFVGARIGYFSMEFGIHESLPIYSGGLGILSGDHLKSASDLGLPLIGIGLIYRQGYFHQRLTTDGWQLEDYPSSDFYQMPSTLVKDDAGHGLGDTGETPVPQLTPVPHTPGTGGPGQPPRLLTIDLMIGRRNVTAQVWKVQVGRVPLYLLDTDLPGNDERDREITQRLYGGDAEMRIRQEILLGIGGMRVLNKLGVTPDVCHMNEGHSAFLTVERIRRRMHERGLDFGEAREAVTPSHVFTTHTPVSAGIDRFENDLLKEYVGPYLDSINLRLDEFTALGKIDAGNRDERFCMAVLALRLSGAANGVSALHGHVSREMWHKVWPGAPRDEVPISSITNGVHINTWISPEMCDLLDRYFGPHWLESPADHDVWRRVDEIPDLELWRVHERRRVALVAFARQRLKEQIRRRGAPPAEVKSADETLDPEALTIGFARRFAPYKRGALIFRDLRRLLKILTDHKRPVQFVFAGKAHPRDDNGKEIIKQITTFTSKPEFRRRIAFIEDYDITVARMLVQGVDVWLNNPIKPREASGTSGMKVTPNGGLNLSILDGWWPEAFDGDNGWAIADGRIHEDAGYRDHLESEAIYELLDKEIVPLFYDRGEDDLPRAWIARMKASMRTICPMFNTNRMLQEYTDQLYVPAAERWRHLSQDGFAAAKALSQWKRSLGVRWGGVRVEQVESNEAAELPVGSRIDIRAKVRLGTIKPDDIAVELYHGRIDMHGQLAEATTQAMECKERVTEGTEGTGTETGTYWFQGEIPCRRSGQHGYAVRVLPRHPDLVHRYDTGLIQWG